MKDKSASCVKLANDCGFWTSMENHNHSFERCVEKVNEVLEMYVFSTLKRMVGLELQISNFGVLSAI